MAELKFPTLEELGRQGGEWALEVFEYKGLTIKQWADKITAGEYQLVKHGRWVHDECGNLVCSNCRWKFSDELPYMSRNLDAKTEEIIGYCMHCGAKMDEKHEGKSADVCFIDEPGNPRYV